MSNAKIITKVALIQRGYDIHDKIISYQYNFMHIMDQLQIMLVKVKQSMQTGRAINVNGKSSAVDNAL